MIYDKISNIGKYKGLNKNLDSAIEWLKKHSADDVDFGITPINKNVWVKKIKSTNLKDDELVCEIHSKTADIHIYSGFDDNIVYELNSNIKPELITVPYNEADDVTFFKATTKEGITPVVKGTFALYLPNEVHCPRRNRNYETMTKTLLKIRW